jgi:hypothetical protein
VRIVVGNWSVEEASLYYCSGTFSINDGVSVINKKSQRDMRFEQSSMKLLWRRIPMLVANPDKVRPDVERPPMPEKSDTPTSKFGRRPASRLRKAWKAFPRRL